MRKIFIWAIIIILLALDWAALDDITTGNEPSLLGEYLILAVSIVIFAGMGIIIIRRKTE